MTGGQANGGVDPHNRVPLKDLSKDKESSMSSTDSEQIMLVERPGGLDPKMAAQLRYYTLVISWVSVVYLTIMGTLALVLAITNKNSSSFAFALDALLDAASSGILIWRYWGAASTVYSAKRESRACITLGVLFILSFMSIVTRSSVALALKVHSTKAMVMWITSIINAVMCMVFLICKAILARKLESIAVATDAVNSGIGFILAFSSVISDWAYDLYQSVWYIDPTIGVICSLFMLGYGIWIIVYELKFSQHSQGHSRLENK